MKQRQRIAIWLMAAVLIVLFALSAAALSRFRALMEPAAEGTGESGAYEYHFALVAESGDDPFWESVYASASQAAKESGVYLERVAAELSDSYTPQQQMRMAIAQQVDGILVSPEGSEEMALLIEEAAQAGIPVVTMMTDPPGSTRLAHVGASSYDLGQEYAKLIQQLWQEEGEEIGDVAILLDNDRASSQEILYSAILEQCEDLPFSVRAITLDSTNSFAAEEDIRSLITSQEETPDVLVCMNYVDTISAYQAVVDYNRVGVIHIIGNYDAEHILSAIEKGIVHSTITVDAQQLGQRSVEALTEYLAFGRTSTYTTVDLIVITGETAGAYLQAKEVGTE